MTAKELRFPPDGAVLQEVRSKVRGMAAELGADESIGDSLALVVDELVNNAIEHGASYRRASNELCVRIEPGEDRLTIEFIDPDMPGDEVDELAKGLAASTGGMPSLDSERGRGLFLLSIYLEGLRAEKVGEVGLKLIGHVLRK